VRLLKDKKYAIFELKKDCPNIRKRQTHGNMRAQSCGSFSRDKSFLFVGRPSCRIIQPKQGVKG